MRPMIARLRAPLMAALVQLLPLQPDELKLLGLMLQILVREVELLHGTMGRQIGRAGALAAIATSIVPPLAHPLQPLPTPAMAEAVEPKSDWLLEMIPNPTCIEG